MLDNKGSSSVLPTAKGIIFSPKKGLKEVLSKLDVSKRLISEKQKLGIGAKGKACLKGRIGPQ